MGKKSLKIENIYLKKKKNKTKKWFLYVEKNVFACFQAKQQLCASSRRNFVTRFKNPGGYCTRDPTRAYCERTHLVHTFRAKKSEKIRSEKKEKKKEPHEIEKKHPVLLKLPLFLSVETTNQDYIHSF